MTAERQHISPGPPRNAVARFARGFTAHLVGLRLLGARRDLRRPAILPTVINFVLFSLLYAAGIFGVFNYLGTLMGDREGFWWALLFWAAIPVVVLVLLAVVAFLFVIIGNLVAAPFNDLLAQRILRLHGLDPAISSGFIDWRQVGRTLSAELRKLGLVIGVQLILLVLNLVPVIGNLAFVAGTLVVTPLLLAFEYLDYSWQLRGFSWAQRKQFIRRHFPEVWGLGAAIAIVASAPLLNLLCIPLSVTAATLTFARVSGGVPPKAGG